MRKLGGDRHSLQYRGIGVMKEESGMAWGGDVPADGGDTIDVGGLLHLVEPKPNGNALGGELSHLSTCSGLMGAAKGRGSKFFGAVGAWGGGVEAIERMAFSTNAIVCNAFSSTTLHCLGFSAFLHLVLRFWNHT